MRLMRPLAGASVDNCSCAETSADSSAKMEKRTLSCTSETKFSLIIDPQILIISFWIFGH